MIPGTRRTPNWGAHAGGSLSFRVSHWHGRKEVAQTLTRRAQSPGGVQAKSRASRASDSAAAPRELPAGPWAAAARRALSSFRPQVRRRLLPCERGRPPPAGPARGRRKLRQWQHSKTPLGTRSSCSCRGARRWFPQSAGLGARPGPSRGPAGLSAPVAQLRSAW